MHPMLDAATVTVTATVTGTAAATTAATAAVGVNPEPLGTSFSQALIAAL